MLPAIDDTLEVRRAILPALKAHPAIIDLDLTVYPARVETNLTWPFIRYDSSIPTPFRASGLARSAHRIRLDTFTRALLDTRGQMIATAEDQCYRINAAVVQALDDATLPLPDGCKARVSWIGSLPMQDRDEKDVWHGSVTFQVNVAG